MTNYADKLCLKWNDFSQNIVNSYMELRKDSDFSDVTLVCEENKQIEAHRTILAASSPVFNTVLKQNKHSHPMIYMRGLKLKDLDSMIEFIYHGEATVLQEDLEGFLALAKELQLKGLAGSKNEEGFKNETKDTFHQPLNIKANNKSIPETNNTEKQKIKCEINQSLNDPLENVNVAGETNLIDKRSFSMSTSKTSENKREDLRATIDSMMERVYGPGGEKAVKCKVCGRETKKRTHMARHVEIHITGVSYSCNMCEAVKGSYNSLNVHKSRVHRKITTDGTGLNLSI